MTPSTPAAAVEQTAARSSVVILAREERRERFGNELEPAYDVVSVGKGSRALPEVRAGRPVIVVARAQMKGMGGLELCRTLRERRDLQGTAVILLLDSDEKEARASGLRAGADAALPVPIEPQVLTAQVETLFRQRRQFRERLLRESAEATQNQPLSFVQRAHQAVRQHVDDDDFGPKDLAEALALSYVQCYRRLQEEANQTPSQFIRSVRLEWGATLLRHGDDSIQRIAASVGFGSASYFTRCFREHAGQTPSAYRRETRTSDETASEIAEPVPVR